MTTELTEFLSSVPLFSGTNEKLLYDVLSASSLKNYEKGEEITSGPPALYCVIHGAAHVYRVEGGRSVILNTIKSGGVFGAAQLFSTEAAFSSVVAAGKCSCLLIPRAAVTELIKRDDRFAVNYIVFLSDRIRFLNKKIASFTAGDGEKTLAEYLLSLPENNGVVKLPSNMSRLAQYLNVSRPTLYRAFSALSENKIIEKNGAYVRIINHDKLKGEKQ